MIDFVVLSSQNEADILKQEGVKVVENQLLKIIEVNSKCRVKELDYSSAPNLIIFEEYRLIWVHQNSLLSLIGSRIHHAHRNKMHRCDFISREVHFFSKRNTYNKI